MQTARERFSPGELAVVLSHYDLGVIESAKEFARGSRRSPKLLLRTAHGLFLLKRRARGRDDLERVVFSHALLKHLQRRGFPVPALLTTRDTHESLLVWQNHVYELFEFVDGQRYDGSLEQTMAAGKALARFHHSARDLDTDWLPPAGGFHDSAHVRSGLNSIPTTTAAHDSVVGHEAELLATTQELYERYDQSADAVNALGLTGWTPWVVHGDWHPGNMLFRGTRVVVVLDFDSARFMPRVVDVANGMLQFSMIMDEPDPERWPAYFDESRMRRFLLGYLSKLPLDRQQRRAIPHLMVESLIAECVVPIAATGSFGHIPGFGVLWMACKKVRWLLQNQGRMERWILE
jgi:Ser/Thr protein kinase RdoA (MazF antagonist)